MGNGSTPLTSLKDGGEGAAASLMGLRVMLLPAGAAAPSVNAWKEASDLRPYASASCAGSPSEPPGMCCGQQAGPQLSRPSQACCVQRTAAGSSACMVRQRCQGATQKLLGKFAGFCMQCSAPPAPVGWWPRRRPCRPWRRVGTSRAARCSARRSAPCRPYPARSTRCSTPHPTAALSHQRAMIVHPMWYLLPAALWKQRSASAHPILHQHSSQELSLVASRPFREANPGILSGR